jgi:glycosyltransferase involved in cell wall biosynthesis
MYRTQLQALACQAFDRKVERESSVVHHAFWGYCNSSLQSLRYERANGKWAVLSQYDTGHEWEQVIKDELKLYKLRHYYSFGPPMRYEYQAAEWETANQVVVNSEWTRNALSRAGVPSDKMALIPIPWLEEPIGVPPHSWSPATRPLKVLFVGRFCVGKGVMYALDAARQLSGSPVQFTFVGTSLIDLSSIFVPDNVTVIEHRSRPEVLAYYDSHDVLLFPTLSDGFGLVQLEALSRNLPVVATNACGTVVVPDETGFVIDTRSAASIVDAIKKIFDAPDCIAKWSANCRQRLSEFSGDSVWPLLQSVLKLTAHQDDRVGQSCDLGCGGTKITAE